MKFTWLWIMTIGSVAALSASVGAAEDAARFPRPAATNLPGRAYPQVEQDLRVTFRIPAPGARQVLLDLGGRGDRLQMTRDGEGVWAVTTAPLTPGFHYYSFVLDGAVLTDASGEGFFGMGRMLNGVEVPSAGEDFSDTKDVPHGEVRIRPYMTRSTGEQRKVVVYTPPDYDANPAARYPVLYLQHGQGEDRRAWCRQGRVNFILDNLIAEGKAKPMIVVMEDGGIAAGRAEGADNSTATGPAAADRLGVARAFERVVVDELIPMVDTSYRTVPDREHRAIAGTGLGGWQALHIGLSHLDLFAHVGGFSPGLPTDFVDRVAKDATGINGRVKLLFLSSGAAEREGNPEIMKLHETWDRARVRHLYYESPGTRHEWLTWRRSLRQFAPQLFQN
jgi:enterochelin esterase family protein